MTMFSVCLQAAIGITCFAAIAMLLNKVDNNIKPTMITVAVLGLVGMLSSMLHLGQPMGAIKAMNQFGSSWLSREIWFTSIFVVLAIAIVVLMQVRPNEKGAVKIMASIAAVVGLIDVFFMAAVYQRSSVAIWQSGVTFVEFYATTFSLGAIVFLALNMKGTAELRKLLAFAVMAAIAIQTVAVVPYLVALGTSGSAAIQGSLTILGDMYAANLIKWACIMVGAVLCLWMVRKEMTSSSMGFIYGSTALLVVGQIVGRYLFYASMVLPRIGLG